MRKHNLAWVIKTNKSIKRNILDAGHLVRYNSDNSANNNSALEIPLWNSVYSKKAAYFIFF